ncbi:S41 family peptidase [Alkaliphilus peptidifermentans]|uniref:Peptidase family S41 n=1 Tax=Alkaliphilus peptidifermentans DSM 18978 TaxID=1120976 RepID=A0A1G5BB31_9FIRM|nr:S41 family peptidase [Alkaliphilus peptidifermentans]SCX87329.1 Peptidase family S41 [Alkaliphilus peptidifermentans DSM 18978]
MKDREEENQVNEELFDEEINQPSSKGVYRILSILLVIAIIFTFVLPPLFSSLSSLLAGGRLENHEAVELINYFEDNYLHQNVFETEYYQSKRAKLLEKNSISMLQFNLFVKDVARNAGDPYTYFSINPKPPTGGIVENRIIDLNNNYMRIYNFKENVSGILRDLLMDNNHRILIIDLRDNVGGNLLELLSIVDFFLPEGIEAFRLEGKGEIRSFITKEKSNSSFEKIFILLNEDSASASEIFALTMLLNMDNVRLIGKKTSGKAVAQLEHKNLDHNYTFSVVTYEWYVENQTAVDLQSYLLEYKDEKLYTLEDYLLIVKEIINTERK